MDTAGPSSQASHSEGANGADRPLPPLPDSELDLYSGGDEPPSEADLSRAAANFGGNEDEAIHENQGQSSRSEAQPLTEEVPSSERNFSDIKGGGSSSMQASEELAGPARQSETPSHFSRTGSDLNPPQNNVSQPSSPNSFTQAETSSESPRDDQTEEMPPLGNDGLPLSRPNHVRSLAIIPGTVNFTGQTGPQYQVLPGYEGVMLPIWQPDDTVTACPICGSTFTMFNRKHHCRKCGKVVCAACSPHRITIPTEYIVKPPQGVGASPPRVSRPLYGSMGTFGLEEGNVERGERVRLCNPCVPDPNTAPPQLAPPPYSGPPVRNERRLRPDDVLPRFEEYRASGSSQNGLRSSTALNPPRSRFAAPQDASNNLRRGVEVTNNARLSRVASNSSQRRQDLGDWRRDLLPDTSGPFVTLTGGNVPQSYYYNPTQRDRDQTRTLQGIERDQRRHGIVGYDPSISSSSQQSIPQSTSRRTVPEEDICPVCCQEYPDHVKLSARSKEQHIQNCIDDQMRATQGPGVVVSPVVSSTGHPARTRSSTNSRRGMTRYTATERDTVPGEECQICLDDFLPSQDLALLTCFCKYHADCILGWWNEGSGHYGRCPTHDHGL